MFKVNRCKLLFLVNCYVETSSNIQRSNKWAIIGGVVGGVGLVVIILAILGRRQYTKPKRAPRGQCIFIH